jgi:hypothetical protein
MVAQVGDGEQCSFTIMVSSWTTSRDRVPMYASPLSITDIIIAHGPYHRQRLTNVTTLLLVVMCEMVSVTVLAVHGIGGSVDPFDYRIP